MKDFSLFRFKFTGVDCGWLDLDISIRYVTFSYSFSNCDGTKPKDFINWLAEIYKGNFSEFDCDSEGFHWYLNYDGTTLEISDTSDIDNTNPDWEKRLRASLQIEKDELCKTIYQSFRDFVNSKDYRRNEWESITFAEALTDAYGSVENALRKASLLNFKEFCEDFFEQSNYDKDSASNPDIFEDILNGKESTVEVKYNQADTSERKNIIQKYLNDYISSNFGENLKLIEIPMLEDLIK